MKQLEQPNNANLPATLRQVATGLQRFREPIAQAVADVHLASTLEADRQRLRLLLSFTLLSLALIVVLVGTGIIIWRALKDREVALQTSQASMRPTSSWKPACASAPDKSMKRTTC